MTCASGGWSSIPPKPRRSGLSMSATWNWAASGSSAKELERQGIVSKVRVSQKGIRSGGCRFSRGALYELLANPIYIGEIRHRQERHPGQHEAILHENSGRECSSGSTRMRRADAVPRTGRLLVRLRESSSTPMVSRCTCRERPRADGATATTSPSAWLMARRSDNGKGWRLSAPELERAVVDCRAAHPERSRRPA